MEVCTSRMEIKIGNFGRMRVCLSWIFGFASLVADDSFRESERLIQRDRERERERTYVALETKAQKIRLEEFGVPKPYPFPFPPSWFLLFNNGQMFLSFPAVVEGPAVHLTAFLRCHWEWWSEILRKTNASFEQLPVMSVSDVKTLPLNDRPQRSREANIHLHQEPDDYDLLLPTPTCVLICKTFWDAIHLTPNEAKMKILLQISFHWQ